MNGLVVGHITTNDTMFRQAAAYFASLGGYDDYERPLCHISASTQRRCFMIKTDPTMLVYDATEQPWTLGYGGNPEDDYGVIVSPHRERAICNLEPRDYKVENARLICAAPLLLKVAQKLLLWMEECMGACDFNQDDIDLYHELRQTIRTAGGFSSETHWWQGPCICDACGHAWQGVVEIPVEATGPQVPLECGECHQMTGGPA